ncbi:phage tail tape measure C-terminal domain-containing protein [Palleronia caenipelagi]|uniref:Bacteriophage tail tape measure C-terminal domain-containing protein n=1 Tax=Palleronia caenipelagi TaxID=2489174 RepID=A0A547PW26_9RHOB|nr:phage tail tape measure C-terminal domain-containing protein [Palleronia caenipelagi]TRD18349.1 hypothetical protein FEV53_11885 [Palleronia caenipelagi]
MRQLRTSLVLSGDSKDLTRALDEAGREFRKAGGTAGEFAQILDHMRVPARRSAQSIIDGATGAGRAMSDARRSAAAFEASLDAQERSFRALKASIDPVYRAEQQFAAAQEQVNRALRTGSASAEEAAGVMRRLEAQYQTARTAALALDGAQGGVGRGSRALRGQIQNTAFQLQDFAVQVSAGTAASVALGQQLPQLLGALGVWGAVIGAAVAIGVPFAASLFDGAEGASDMGKALDALNAATDRYAAALKAALIPGAELRALFGDLGDEIERLRDLQLAGAERAAGLSVRDLGTTIARDLGGISRTRVTGADQSYLGDVSTVTEFERALARVEERYKLSASAAELFLGQIEALGAADGAEAQAKILRNITELLSRAAATGDDAARALGSEDGLLATFEGALEATLDRVKTAASETWATLLAEATARQRDLDALTKQQADARARLAAAEEAADAEAARAARAVLDLLDEKARAITDTEGRVDALTGQFGELSLEAGRIAFDQDGAARQALYEMDRQLQAARTGIDDLNDADLSTLEAAMAALKSLIDGVSDSASEMGRTLSRAQVDAYQAYGRSRATGDRLSATDRLQASRDLIIRFEGKAPAGKWDENAFRAGYGSSTVTLADGSVREITEGMQISWADAGRDLDRRIRGYHDALRGLVGETTFQGFTPAQIAAIASIQHNYGAIPGQLRPALQTGDAQIIAEQIARMAMHYTRSERAAGKTGKPLNYDRRMAEAALFGDVRAQGLRNTTALGDQATAERDARRAAEIRDREARRQSEESARAAGQRDARDARTRDQITGALDTLTPAYARDLAAAERWRDAELARADSWQAGVTRGLRAIEAETRTFADVSADLFTTWSDGIGDAIGKMVQTGKFEISDLIDYTAAQFAKLAFQQTLQPGLNSVLNTLIGGLGAVLPGGLGGLGAAALPTAHTGGTGIMRTLSAGASLRGDEHLAVLRRGEEVFTPRMLENAGAIVDALASSPPSGGPPVAIDARPQIQIIQNTPVQIEAQQGTDARGRRQTRLVISEAVGEGIAAPGGRGGRVLTETFGLGRRGVAR